VFQYDCKICIKTCSTKKGLEVHMSEKHRSAADHVLPDQVFKQ
jgi:hypothetical protein